MTEERTDAGRRPHSHSRGSASEPAPDSAATLGLLGYVTAHAIDDDYRLARQSSSRRGSPILTVAVLAVFTVLLITAATQTSRNAVADARERNDLISQIKSRRTEVAQQQNKINALRRDVSALTDGLSTNLKLSAGTRARLGDLGVLSGISAVAGPGVQITVDDAPGAKTVRDTVLDSDVQLLINGLWQAGAEAIAINDERITGLTAISQAGSAINVNYHDLTRPYVVSAIGDPKTLPARFADTAGGQTWLDLHQQVGLRFDVRTRSRMDLPSADTPALRSAKPGKGGAS